VEVVKVQVALVDRAKDLAVHHEGLQVILVQVVIGQVQRRTLRAVTAAMPRQARRASALKYADRLA
jgi:hypothetical protein